MSALLGALPWLSGVAFAAPTVEPLAQVRPRIEVRTNSGVPTVSQRTRLGAVLSAESVAATVVIQDVRTWGEETNTLLDFTADQIDLRIGFLAWNPYEWLTLTAGRQELSLHEQRLIGAVGWAQPGRAFDGVLASADGDWSADVGAVVLASSNAATSDTDGFLGILRLGHTFDAGQFDLLYLPLADEARSRLSHTAGVYAKGKAGTLHGRAEAYVQVGQRDDAPERAFLVGLSGAWEPEADGSPRVGLWYDYLSGDGDDNDGISTAFDTLFATNHKFYGLIDVMTFSEGGLADDQGLQDGAVKLAISPVAGTRLHLDGHLFFASTAGSAVLGQEVDLTVRSRLNDSLVLTAGAAVLARPSMAAAGWSFLQLDARL